MVAVVLALPRPEEVDQPAVAPGDVAFPGDAPLSAAADEEKKVDGRHRYHHNHHGNIF